MTRLVILSDTHGMHDQVDVPDGDVLIHCGDALEHGLLHELREFAKWIEGQPHKHKVVVAGNHDWVHEISPEPAQGVLERAGVTYLCDRAERVAGLNIYGSPLTPEFYNWAFMRPRGVGMRAAWKPLRESHRMTPLDVLVTHGPPFGIGDLAPGVRHAGCLQLLNAVHEIQPRVHAFGHIHEGYGRYRSDEHETLFVNAATCTGDYAPTNKPQVVDL